MATIDLDNMLAKIKASQWALADIDWEAPGAEMISEAQWPKLKAFMSDLMWIEHVGARGFAAMAKKAPTDTLREIYTYFHAEEQRHANAEMALMRRWGMLEGEELPEPNINLRLTIEWLDRYSDDMPLEVLGSVIPMLEIALDGALLKFLLDEVNDPLCHQVFEKINADEARHLGVDFHVMEMLGRGRLHQLAVKTIGTVVSPKLIMGVLAYAPLLNRMRDNIVEMGLKEERLYEAMDKYQRIGGRTKEGRRNPWFQIISQHGRMVVDRSHIYHKPVDALVKLSNYIPRRALGPVPSWVKELTWRPTA
ncbi:ferritin-like domain-containing protein [Marinobacter sp. BGYM27]|uniref:ferritin-like domain-containing protein n=1 Tax=unclassified Marinobacter TaxID=83889 RepID=UPI0021A374B5|nr:ferritin-like domain-containing protein [Marinobacter sp. BGYM27]MDG5501046.1 ferritin-like domain-containing protein [Marinobacter sp. BGYM27]